MLCNGVLHFRSVMKEGKIVESGQVQKLFDNPQHPYTIKLLNSIPGKKDLMNLKKNILLEASEVDINYPISKNLFGKTIEFLNAVKKVSINIINFKIVSRSVDFFEMQIDVEVNHVKHLKNIIAALRATPVISSVERARG